jgi:two-component system, LuxR family, sensor kinase FixL
VTLLKNADNLPDGALLRQILSCLLRSGAPKVLLWGEQFHTFFNHAYAQLDPQARLSRSGDTMAALLPEAWLQMREHLQQAAQGIERLSVQVTIREAGSGRIRLTYTAFLTPLYGEGASAKGVLIDIHERTEEHLLADRLTAEKLQLQQLFGELPVFMAYASGKELRLQFVNTAFRRLYGFRPLEGLTVAEAIPEAAEQGFVAILEDVLRSGEPYLGKRTPLRLRDDSVRYVDFIYQPVRNGAGKPAGILCTGIDMTEAHRLAQEGEAMQHRALHASRINAMGTMAMTIAHELNQPLAAAASYLSAARRFVQKVHGAGDQDMIMLDLAAEQIRRAGKIIQRAKPLLHSANAARANVSVSQAVDNALSILTAGRGTDFAVTKLIEPDAQTVLADDIQLEQVLVNLLRNAMQAAGHVGRRELIVSSRTLNGKKVRITVRDFGCGLDADKIDQLFDLGALGSGTSLGIGLPLSRTLIEANGGILWAANAAGGGAEFHLELERPSSNESAVQEPR